MALNECADPTSYLKLIKLHTAISSRGPYDRSRSSELKCIERILKQDGDINYRIPNTVMLKSCHSQLVGCTILHLHYRLEDRGILNLLLDHGADFTMKTPKGQTVIHEWQLHKDCWSSPLHNPCVSLVLSAYLKHQITENPVNLNGLSHFHAACMTNNVEAINFFLANGVSVQQRVNEDSPVFAGYTALHFATRFDCLEAVKLLLLRGAKVDAQDARNMTPLHLIIFRILRERNSNRFSEKMIDIVEEIVKSYDIHDAQDHFGLSYLHVLCILKDSSRLERHLNEFQNVNCAMNVDSPIRPGSTPLHFAALFNFGSLKLLIAKGADITIKDAEDKTALDLCIARYRIEAIYEILVRSTFKDVTLSNGKTKLTDLIYSMRSLSHFKKFLRELGDANAHIPADSHLWPGHTPLHLAIILQDRCDEKQREMLVQMTEECLKSGVDVQAKSAFDQTPLHFAFRRGCADAVDLMLKQNPGTTNLVDEGGLSYLHIACAASNKKVVRALLDNGADVNCKLGSIAQWYSRWSQMPTNYSPTAKSQTLLPNGSTPLHVAVAVADDGMARLLLDRGADPQAQDADGLTVVHRSFLSDVEEILELRDELMSSENLRECVADSCGLSHLHVACNIHDLDAMKRLLLEPEPPLNRAISSKTSDDLDLRRLHGDTPLSMATCAYGINGEVVKLLLQQGADILADSGCRQAPLLNAMTGFDHNLEYYYWGVFVAKIRSDEDLHRRVVERVPGLTDLHLACYGRDQQWIEELLAVRVDVNARIRDDSPVWSGYTPLHVLMKKERFVDKLAKPDAILQLLLDNGADLTIPADCRLNTPLHLAERWSSVDETMLPDVPCDRASVMIRSIKDFTSNPTNTAGVSHFHIACRCLDVAGVEGFLKHGVDVNAKLDYFYDRMGGYTPLHVTLTRSVSSPRKKTIVELLLKYGADLRAESYSGNTALHYAAMNYVDLTIFKMIIDAGADINAKNVLGASPLEILLKLGEVSVEWIKYFIESGCRINQFNCDSEEGFMPMIIVARKLEKQDVKTLLLDLPNISEVDEMGRSAIHNIVSTGAWFCSRSPDERFYVELIEELEKLGCDVDRQDKSGQTALHAAARFQNHPAIAALLAVGADINVVDATGKTAFAYGLLERRDWGYAYPSERPDTVELIANHVSKLRLVGLHVDALNECSQEIARNKKFRFISTGENHFRSISDRFDNASVKVGSELMTLRDFVSANGPVWEYSKLRRMNHEHVIELFKTILDKRYEKKLGDLRCLVRLQYRNYSARSRLVGDAKRALNVMANFRVPELCSEAILASCANWELRNVIGAVE